MAAEAESLHQESAGVAIPRFARVWLNPAMLLAVRVIVMHGAPLLRQICARPYDYRLILDEVIVTFLRCFPACSACATRSVIKRPALAS